MNSTTPDVLSLRAISANQPRILLVMKLKFLFKLPIEQVAIYNCGELIWSYGIHYFTIPIRIPVRAPTRFTMSSTQFCALRNFWPLTKCVIMKRRLYSQAA